MSGTIVISANILMIGQTLGQEQHDKVYFGSYRNYSQIPFDQVNTAAVCKDETSVKPGEKFSNAATDMTCIVSSAKQNN